LSKCVVGALLQDGGEEAEENEEEKKDSDSPKKDNTFNICGTLKNTDEEYKQDASVKEIVEVYI
jgi:hypothetical protein